MPQILYFLHRWPTVLCLVWMLWQLPSVAAGDVVAFPGAEGFAADTCHARGKPVFIVTRLDDEPAMQKTRYLKPGQFRWALAKAEEAGGGYIVFEVAGTIELQRSASIPSHTYIAGQTAPGTGISLVNQSLWIGQYKSDTPTHDIVIRYLRGRGQYGKGLDFLVIHGARTARVICDHLSVSGFQDGAVDIVENAREVTLQWCHFGDGHDSLTNENYHCEPHLLSKGVSHVTIHHCFYTHVHSRVPWLTTGSPEASLEFSNNLIYNYRKYPTVLESSGGRGIVVGNLYIPGRNSHGDEDGRIRPPVLVKNGFRAYFRDNLSLGGTGHDNRGPDGVTFRGKDQHVMRGRPVFVSGSRTRHADPESNIVGTDTSGEPMAGDSEALEPFADFPPVQYTPVDQVMEVVLSLFGVVPHDRTDQRLIREVLERQGNWRLLPIDDKNEEYGRPVPDLDRDGMPDEWERTRGKDLDPNGHDLHPEYENIEIYLAERAEQRLRLATPVHVPPSAFPKELRR